MADFNKLTASKKIEDKLKAAQDPECPAEALDKIVMDGAVPWGTELGITLANAIASNPTFVGFFVCEMMGRFENDQN